MIFVTVSAPAGRDVFVNGEYATSRGTICVSFSLSPGSHHFETVARQGEDAVVDFEGWVTDVPDRASRTIALSPVTPPRPIILPYDAALPLVAVVPPRKKRKAP